MCFPVSFDTAAAKVNVGAADVVVIGTAISVRGVTTVLWCCWFYSAAVVVGFTVLLLSLFS